MRTFAVALLLAGSSAARAETVVLLPASGANVSEAHLAAATDVLRVHLELTGRFVVVRAPAAAPGIEPTPAEAAAAARDGNASLAVVLRIARLGQNATVRLAAYRPTGAVAHVDQLPAGDPDDLDAVLRRLALGLATGTPARQLAEATTPAPAPDPDPIREPPAVQELPSRTLMGMSLGVLTPARRVGSSPSQALSGGGVFWLFDGGAFLADANLSFHFSDVDPDSSPDVVTAFGFGAYYPLLRSDLTPYLGGGVDYSWSRFGGSGGNGLSGRAALGAILGRTTRVVVRAEVGWFANFYADRASTGGVGSTANGPYLSVGLAAANWP